MDTDAYKQLYDLYVVAKSETNNLDYINELIDQILFFGTETNKLTKTHVQERLKDVLESIERSLLK